MLYAVDFDHFILTARESPALDGQTLVKMLVQSQVLGGNYLVLLPSPVFRFYQL